MNVINLINLINPINPPSPVIFIDAPFSYWKENNWSLSLSYKKILRNHHTSLDDVLFHQSPLLEDDWISNAVIIVILTI